ncbi:MAG: hypothetical protein EB084_07455, partial [Proteobacteria bacterium]|nr:hypothetical protein [Pseudomonadota bacterium]
MDPQQIKHTALMLSVGVAALSLMTSLPALLGGRPRHPAALGAALAALAGGLAMAAICGIVGLRLPPGTGGRGAALMLGLGALAAPLATFVGARGSRDDDAENAPPSAAWSLMPG